MSRAGFVRMQSLRGNAQNGQRAASSILTLACVVGIGVGGLAMEPVAAAEDAARSPNSSTAGANAANHHTFAEVVREHFAKWDLNHDGKLEAAELDELIKRPRIHGDEAAALATIKKRDRHAIAAKITDYAASEQELEKGVEEGPVRELDTARGESKPFHFEPTYEKLCKQLAEVNRQLYAHDQPDFALLHQGGIGDCFFFSVVGNLAAHQPHRIQRMIEPEERGGYVVHFGDGVEVKVAKPSDVEIVVNNSTYTIEDGIWLTVLEKAVGHRIHDTAPPAKRTKEDTDTIAMGGSTRAIISMFTGHQTDAVKLRDPKAEAERLSELRREITAALHARRLVAISMGKDPPPANNGKKVPGLGYGHAYAVFGYDPAIDMIKVWNPWGNDFKPKGPPGAEHGFETKHGEFEVKLETLYRQFSAVDIETTRKLEPPHPKR